MKEVRWLRFAWELHEFPHARSLLPPSFAIRRARPEDRETATAVVLSAFTLNSDWNPYYREVRPFVDKAFQEVFDEQHEPFCLILTHGARIIGVSGLCSKRDASNHLLTGPCLSMEYHNRGLSTALLLHSLLVLKEAGVPIAYGVTKQGSFAAQFIYPKFGSALLAESE